MEYQNLVGALLETRWCQCINEMLMLCMHRSYAPLLWLNYFGMTVKQFGGYVDA